MRGIWTWLRRVAGTPRLRRRAFVLLACLALSFVPMAGTLGYFSSLLLAPVLSLLAAAAGVDAVREVRGEMAGPRRADPELDGAESGPEALWRVAGLVGRDLAWLLGLPVAALTLGMLWTTNCDPFGGALYYLMGPVISAGLGAVAGVAGAVLVGPRRRVAQLCAGWLPFLFCVVVGVHRLYVDPVVFAFDPFFGWFSGPIYDEGVAIGRRYLQYRAYNLAGAAAVMLLLRASVDASLRPSWRRALADGPQRLRSVVGLALALATLMIGLSGPRWGFTATRESIAKVLSATRETEHFEIHYAPGSITAREIDVVAAEHEFAWRRLEQRLGRAPARKVQSFVFANGGQRRVLVGADKVEVSPPWRQQMYLSHRRWPHDVMHHELAHAFLGDHGDRLLGLPIAGGRFNGALVEGVPTALAPRALDNLGLHEQAAVLDRLDKRPPLARIMGAGFWGAAASRAYTASGSFVLWLAETRGWPAVAELYQNAGDFEASYGASLAELEQDWLAFIRAIPLRDEDVEAQAQRFERSSVFRRPCAHRAAELAREAALARRRDQPDEALEIQRTLCRIEPDRPGHFLRLADMMAQWGELAEAEAVLDELAARDELTSTVRAVIEEQRGDTALVAGDLDEAGAHYRAAMEFGLREAVRRRLEIKLRATEHPKLAPLIADYFAPFSGEDNGQARAMLLVWTATKIAELDGQLALGHYLLGLQFLNIAAPEQAAEVLALALDPPAGEPGLDSPAQRRAARWALVSALVQTRRWQPARALLDEIEAHAEGDGHRMEVQEWRERIDFFEGWFSARE